MRNSIPPPSRATPTSNQITVKVKAFNQSLYKSVQNIKYSLNIAITLFQFWSPLYFLKRKWFHQGSCSLLRRCCPTLHYFYKKDILMIFAYFRSQRVQTVKWRQPLSLQKSLLQMSLWKIIIRLPWNQMYIKRYACEYLNAIFALCQKSFVCQCT